MDVRSRGVLKGQLTRLLRFITATDQDVTLTEIEARMRVLREIYDKFMDVQAAIEASLGDGEFPEQEAERAGFESEYFRTESLFLRRKGELNECALALPSATPGGYHGIVGSQVLGAPKLPPIDLPEFSGSLTEWRSYRELFDSIVDTNPGISTVNKFFYLRSTLKGDALKLIGSLAVTERNYVEARRILADRYENVRCVVQAHLKCLFGVSELRNGTVTSLRGLLDSVTRHVSSLRALGENVHEWDTVLVYLLCSRLDPETRRCFELHFMNETPSFAHAVGFLNQRCLALERVEPAGRPRVANPVLLGCKEQRGSGGGCRVCKRVGHRLFDCPEFARMTVKDRFNLVRKERLCLNCFGAGHRAQQCTSRSCSKCSERHNSLLHFADAGRSVEATTEPSTGLSADKAVGVASVSSPEIKSVSLRSSAVLGERVFLFTVMLRLRTKCGRFRNFRALLDTGSQACFVTRGCSDELGLHVDGDVSRVCGIGGVASSVVGAVELLLCPLVGSYKLGVRALVLPEITCDLPQISLSREEIEPFMSLSLADPEWFRLMSIDILLSNAVFMRILKSGVYESPKSGLRALSTRWGWIVGGDVSIEMPIALTVVCMNTAVQDIEFDLRRFWEIEEPLDGRLDEEDPGESHFCETVRRGADGRFVVELPFRTHEFEFSRSASIALNRFKRLEKRFENDHEYKNMYSQFINDGLRSGVFERVHDSAFSTEHYYLPHHGVIKQSSTHTKLRCVFDGTASSAGSQSINSVLHTGPKRQNDLFGVLLRFRAFRVAFVADIERMFCQVEVNKKHRDFSRFFWRDVPDDPVGILRHARLPFGLTCSPFVAVRCLHALADEFEDRFSGACGLIRDGMYVDDLVAGSNTVADARHLLDDLIHVCGSAGFNFRGWTSNSESLMRHLGCVAPHRPLELIRGETTVLGIGWCSEEDCFRFNIRQFSEVGATKRGVLSQLSQMFDPLGWLGPVIVKGKILIQRLWTCGSGWDEPIPGDIAAEWGKIVSGLRELSVLRIGRFVGDTGSGRLCGFSDASIQAYGACVYLIDSGHSRLVAARSRVAPLKSVTLARLELCGAVMCAGLMSEISSILGIPFDRCTAFCDSRIVLSWLAKPSYTWKVFVANRVSEVHRKYPGGAWRYVRSAENPADLLSRGVYPLHLVGSSVWWHGPDWLPEYDGRTAASLDLETVEEARTALIGVVSDTVWDRIMSRCSSYLRMLRVAGWVIRFVTNVGLTKLSRIDGPLRTDELNRASVQLVRRVQYCAFRAAIDSLRSGHALRSGDPLLSLTPWIDGEGLLRLGGRLRNSQMSDLEKHPLILPKSCGFVEALVRYEHFRGFHQGSNYLLGIIRRRYWIINGRSTIAKIVKRCVVCFRHRPTKSAQLQGELPSDRVREARPFTNVGVDLCVPFSVRPVKGRGRITYKIFVALSVCFSVKAIHLETVSDLSADTFLASFRRFVGRRGLPSTVYSDNGRNFLGTQNYLKEWRRLLAGSELSDLFSREFANRNIEWRFIPPRSPSFGGLWEGNIRIFKNCLRKTLGESIVTIEEFQTLLIGIEACLNSRPLCRVSESPDDLGVLTPGHFLVGASLVGLPDSGGGSAGRLGVRWRHMQSLLSHYWKRWKREYLLSLAQRSKSKKEQKNVQVGDVGVLVSENTPPYVWPLCRVTDAIQGADGLVRVIRVRVGNTEFKRAATKFCSLPDFSCEKSPGSMLEPHSE